MQNKEASKRIGHATHAPLMLKMPLVVELPFQQDRVGIEVPKVEIMGSCKGQTHPIYILVDKYQALDFRSSAALNGLPVKEWLEIVKDIMRIFNMTNIDKIQYASLFLKDDAKVWWWILCGTCRVLEITWFNFRCAFKKEYLLANVLYVKA